MSFGVVVGGFPPWCHVCSEGDVLLTANVCQPLHCLGVTGFGAFGGCLSCKLRFGTADCLTRQCLLGTRRAWQVNIDSIFSLNLKNQDAFHSTEDNLLDQCFQWSGLWVLPWLCKLFATKSGLSIYGCSWSRDKNIVYAQLSVDSHLLRTSTKGFVDRGSSRTLMFVKQGFVYRIITGSDVVLLAQNLCCRQEHTQLVEGHHQLGEHRNVGVVGDEGNPCAACHHLQGSCRKDVLHREHQMS